MKVSIITIVRNGEAVLERTIQSVLAQTHKDIEYIIVDGASTDGTLAVAQKYAAHVSKLVSEPDKGISDAWNKGIPMASGGIIGLLNAGDEYFPDTVEQAVKALAGRKGIIYGDTELVDDQGRVRLVNRGRFSLWKHSGGIGFYHPSCFATRDVYQEVGLFELGYRYAMDVDWIIRAHQKGIDIRHAPVRVKMLDDGVSVQHRYRAYGEYLHIIDKYSGRPHLAYMSMFSTAARGIVKLMLGRA